MFLLENYYYLVIGLQAICAFHCIRRGNQQKWIWLIVFLPLIGCFIYIFTEIINKNQIQGVQSNISSALNPSGRIRKLEDNLRFSNTFNNNIALADAYLSTGRTDEAIEIYERSLTGAFSENEHVLTKLINAYYEKERYNDVVTIVSKVYRQLKFNRSREHMLYALALDKLGNTEKAENEFKMMNGNFSYYEPRYEYGLFLERIGRIDDSIMIFEEITAEEKHLSSAERRDNRKWFSLAKEKLRATA